MNKSIGFLFLLSTALLLTGSLTGCSKVYEDPLSIGSISIVSEDLVMGYPGKLRLQFTAGVGGVATGDRILVELPKGWSNYTGSSEGAQGLKYQFTDEEKDGFFEVLQLPEGVKVKIDVHSGSDIYDIDHRFSQLLVFEIDGRNLLEGETFEIECQHHLIDGVAILPITAGSGHIRWTVISPGVELNKHGYLPNNDLEAKTYPTGDLILSMSAGDPEQLLVTIPSVLVEGEEGKAKIRLLDRYYNLVSEWPEEAILSYEGEVLDLPESTLMGESGVAIVPFTPTSSGTVRIYASIGKLEGTSNPLVVSPDEPVSTSIFWGDIHSHSWMSHDGQGIDPYYYAYNASALDFYSVTEHHISMSDEEWEMILDMNEAYLSPGEFVTLVAAEHGTASPSGHFNLYFSQDRPTFTPLDIMSEIPIEYGEEQPLVINHHTGIIWKLPFSDKWNERLSFLDDKFGPSVDWDAFPGLTRDAVEIYSLHGQSEYYNPDDPLSYEHVYLTLPKEFPPEYNEDHTGYSEDGPHFARDGWAEGLIMGTVAGSDDHHSQPGKVGGGLTAVLVDELTREAVFEAIKNRHTYATTGDRIVLGFTINGNQMGSVLPMTEELQINISAVGTDKIILLQLIKYDFVTDQWEIAISEEPGTAEVSLLETLENFGPSLYYVRLEQKGLSNGRVVRAWSSPIWVGVGEEIE